MLAGGPCLPGLPPHHTAGCLSYTLPRKKNFREEGWLLAAAHCLASRQTTLPGACRPKFLFSPPVAINFFRVFWQQTADRFHLHFFLFFIFFFTVGAYYFLPGSGLLGNGESGFHSREKWPTHIFSAIGRIFLPVFLAADCRGIAFCILPAFTAEILSVRGCLAFPVLYIQTKKKIRFLFLLDTLPLRCFAADCRG